MFADAIAGVAVSDLQGRFTLDHCLALDEGSRECLPIVRKKVRGVSLADVLAADRDGLVALMTVLDRAVLRQAVGLDADDDTAASPARQRVNAIRRIDRRKARSKNRPQSAAFFVPSIPRNEGNDNVSSLAYLRKSHTVKHK